MNRKSIFSALIILAVSFLLTGSTAPAQGGPGGGMRGPRPESVVNQLRDSLDLSKEQLARVTDIVSATFDADNLKVQLANASKETRVHVFATRYLPEFPIFNAFRVTMPGLDGREVGVAESGSLEASWMWFSVLTSTLYQGVRRSSPRHVFWL